MIKKQCVWSKNLQDIGSPGPSLPIPALEGKQHMMSQKVEDIAVTLTEWQKTGWQI